MFYKNYCIFKYININALMLTNSARPTHVNDNTLKKKFNSKITFSFSKLIKTTSNEMAI